MRFSELTADLERIKQASLIEKRALSQKVVGSAAPRELPPIVALLAGESLTDRAIVLPRSLIEKALSSASGRPIQAVRSEIKRIGSIPQAARSLLKNRAQMGFSEPRATICDVISDLEMLSQAGLKRSIALLRLVHLLSDLDADGACVVLRTILRQSRSYVPRSMLADALAERFGLNRQSVLSLVAQKGWRTSALMLLAGLPSSPQAFIRRPSDGEEGRQGRPKEGYE